MLSIITEVKSSNPLFLLIRKMTQRKELILQCNGTTQHEKYSMFYE